MTSSMRARRRGPGALLMPLPRREGLRRRPSPGALPAGVPASPRPAVDRPERGDATTDPGQDVRLRLVPSRSGWGVADAFPDEEPLRRASVASVVVGVHDARRRTAVLLSSLPEGWSTVAVALATDDGPAQGRRAPALVPGICDVLLLVDPPASGIREAREAAGQIPVVVLLTVEASASQVVEVLQAGADSCVRGVEPAAVLVAHLRACLRRGTHR